MAKLISPKEMLEQSRRKRAMENSDPTGDQTAETIGAFLMASEVDTEVVIRSTYGGMLSFFLTSIAEIGSGRRSRYIYTRQPYIFGGAAWYRATGINARSPGGQGRLVQPTQDILDFMKAHPAGELGHSRFLPSELWELDL